jgi:diacylglycerol kinase (ATP)
VRIALAANLASGGGLDPEPAVAALRACGAQVEVFGCDPEELERLVRTRPGRVAVAGGDGTIGPVAVAAGRLGVPLGVLPTGTANDFARANGLPDELEAAAELIARGEALRRLELGRLAGGRPFVNAASAGLASVAARRADPLKPLLGPLAYAAGAVRAAATASPLRVALRVDGEPAFAGTAWQVIVAVTGAFGGGAEVGAADARDGRLDVAVLPAGSRLGLARRAWGLRQGTIAAQEGVEHRRGRLVEVLLPAGTELNVDGELSAGGLERVTVEPDAYGLVVPG